MIYHLLPELESYSARKGGAIAHSVGIILRLSPDRTVVCHDADDTWGSAREQILTLPRLHLFSRIRGRTRLPFAVLAPLMRWIYEPLLSRLQSGDILWCHNRPIFAAALAAPARTKGVRIVFHSHDGDAPEAYKLAFSRFLPDASIFVSDHLRRYWLRIVPHLTNTHVIYNGADEESFYPAADRTPRPRPLILFVGRIHPVKGVHVLTEAMRLLEQRGVQADCKIVGSAFSGGTKPTKYVARVMATAPASVSFAPHRSAREIAEEFRQADIFCCPSIWEEPFGKVNVEAMASQVPVVASSVGGIPEIAAQGGIHLVKPGDPHELANALGLLVGDPLLRQTVGAQGRHSYERRFVWSHITRQYDALAEHVNATTPEPNRIK